MRISDWSSDVCSSDLGVEAGFAKRRAHLGLEPAEGLAELPVSCVEETHGSRSRIVGRRKRRKRTERVDEPHLLDAAAVGLAQAVAAKYKRERFGACNLDIDAVAREEKQIGRAACRERVCDNGAVMVGGGS